MPKVSVCIPTYNGAAYLAATMYQFDDNKPYLYKTTDNGKSWTRIVNGIPDGAFTRVVREDPAKRGLLFAGTETGLYVSLDDGGSWQAFQRNLPATLGMRGPTLVISAPASGAPTISIAVIGSSRTPAATGSRPCTFSR